MGMAAVFIVEDGPTAGKSLPPPPMDFATCGDYESYLETKKSEVSHIDGV
jgi:laccase